MPFEAHIIELPKILDDRGNLTFIEGENHIPFKIERTYWIYDGSEVKSRQRQARRLAEGGEALQKLKAND